MIARHLLDRVARRQQLAALGRVDAVEAAVGGGRAGDPHVHLGRTGRAHHVHDLGRGGAAHDAVVDQDHPLAGERDAVGVVLQLHAEMADLVGRLDEGAADIVVADDAELEGEAGFLRVADRRRHAAVGHRHHDVGRHAALAGELGADPLAHLVDALALDDAVGPGEVDVLEDAEAAAARARTGAGCARRRRRSPRSRRARRRARTRRRGCRGRRSRRPGSRRRRAGRAPAAARPAGRARR